MGKTIQMIALILTERGPVNMPTLIVCPTGLLDQWVEEINRFCTKEAGVKVLLYHKSSRKKDPTFIASHDIVVTTYGILTQEASGIRKADDRLKKSTKKKNPKAMKPPRKKSNPVLALSQVQWFRIILDECQNVKNETSKGAAACATYTSYRRWCLSGTPVQNRPMELLSYYRFLRYKPFGSSRVLKELVGSAAQSNQHSKDLIHQSFHAVSMRRTKGQ